MMDPVQIEPVLPDRRSEVLGLVFRDLPAAERAKRVSALANAAATASGPIDGLLEARRGGQLVGGILAEVHAGRGAVVLPPRLVPSEPASTTRLLLDAAIEFLSRNRVRTAQALLGSGGEDDGRVLESAGFERLAELLYLVSVEAHFPGSRPGTTLEFEPYCPANRARLGEVVEASYEGTLDCPRLNGVQAIDDVLAGYRATGVFDPSRWLLVSRRGQPVGCLLMADHPEHENWELVYMGVIPSARGHGLGQQIVRHAQWLAGRAGRRRLVLAVDAANTPAIGTYTQLGFECWDQRQAYWKLLDDR